MTPDQVRLLNTVDYHLQGGRPAQAAKVLDRVARELPDAPRVWAARATLAMVQGDPAGAETALNRTAALDPNAADPMASLGALLHQQNRPEEAARAWREALRREPNFVPAIKSLALYLMDTGQIAEAVSELDRGLTDVRNPDLLTLRADAKAEMGDTEGALADYREVVMVVNGSAPAFHNLGLALIQAGYVAEGEAAIRKALDLEPNAAPLWQVLGQALVAGDLLAEAQEAFEAALARDPLHPGAHRDLAQLIWIRTGDVDAALSRVNQALGDARGFSPLTVIKAKLLEFVGDLEAARVILTEAAGTPGAPNYILCAASQVLLGSNPLQAAVLAAQAVGRAPRDVFGLSTLAQAQLAAGDQEGAELTAARIRKLAPFDQHGVALQATAWRLRGEPRYREWFAYQDLVRAAVIDTPDGWPNLAAYLHDLGEALTKLHGHQSHPIGQSLRGGTQTNVPLERSEDPAIKAFFRAIEAPIRAYIDALGAGDDPVRGRATGDYRLSGSWSIRLRSGGRHVDHLHNKGWLSSAFYVSLPPGVAGGEQGRLRFGQPGIPTQPVLEAEHIITPQPGMLVLFPSYMWHGTEPFEDETPRLTIAFDVVPA